MARLREQKKTITSWLESSQWRSHIPAIVEGGSTSLAPLFSLLLSDTMMRLRAAIALGAVTSAIQKKDDATAKDVVRRLMWRMSEESGNIGWGVPEAFGEVLSQSDALAKAFSRPFVMSIVDLGFDDNYCDNDALRRSCYFAIGRFLRAQPSYIDTVRPVLRKGLADIDAVCRGMTAWALGGLPQDINDAPPLRRLAESEDKSVCTISDGDSVRDYSVCELARLALEGKSEELL